MGWRDKQTILAALRVEGGGIEQATLVLLKLVKGWRIMSGQPLELVVKGGSKLSCSH